MKKIVIVVIIALSGLNVPLKAKRSFNVLDHYVNYKQWKSHSRKNYLTKKGTILVTPDKAFGAIPTGHSAIIHTPTKVVEANRPGVEYTNNDWYATKSYTIALRVNGLSDKHHEKAADYAKKQQGKKYNYYFYFNNMRNSFYCSQLIWAAFYDLYKVNLDTKDFGLAKNDTNGAIHPMELVKSNKTKVTYFYKRDLKNVGQAINPVK